MKSRYIVLLVLVLYLTACHDDPPQHEGKTTLRVAVLMQEQERQRWERTAAWAQENIRKAQQGMEHPVELQLTFHSQDDAQYMVTLANDTNVDAIVGPTTSACATQLASLLTKSNKPMLSPTATGVEYQRRFATKSNIWNMAECDIAELEALLSVIKSTNTYRRVALLAADDDTNGNNSEFTRWFGFLATEYHLQVDGLYFYQTEQDVRNHARQLCGTDWHKSEVAVVFVPTSSAIAIAFDDEIGKLHEETSQGKYLYIPQVFGTDVFVADSIRSQMRNLTYQGLALYPSPESGFATMYATRFNNEVQNGEAQLYDALMLLSLAAAYRNAHTDTPITLNEALEAVVSGRDEAKCDWLPTGLQSAFQMIAAGLQPDISGATGELTFDIKNRSGIQGTCYRLWRLHDKEYLTIGYLSGAEGNRTYNSTAHWEQSGSVYQSFDESTTYYPTYPALGDRWALLVAGSKGWANYRFQADVFAMYQILRRHGYDDDHIVLVCEDDVAYHSANVEQGVLRVNANGENVYAPDAIDYKLSDLLVDDIHDILLGKVSERLPEVIQANANDNVFVFWSGHGDVGEFDYGGRHMSYATIVNALKQMPHRKMLMVVEACYSGGLGLACETIPGMLVITAANSYETSHAAVWDETLGIYRSNGFTHGFQTAIASNAAISLRDLYYALARSTSGSHVTVYNAPYYGNIYTEQITEFIE